MPPKINERKCQVCGNCIDLCPGAVFELDDGTVIVARQDDCLDCGSCAEECPTNAITFEE